MSSFIDVADKISKGIDMDNLSQQLPFFDEGSFKP